jgi:hypothetical protein
MKLWRICAFAFVAMIVRNAVFADTVTITYKGFLVTSGPVGSAVSGVVRFPNGLPDLLPGGLEDWWQAPGFADFSFSGNGITFKATSGSSELRIKDRAEDALRYDGVSGATSLILLLSGGDVNALLPGSGGLTGSIPALLTDPSLFAPCVPNESGNYGGSCSQFATSAGTMLFQLTELEIVRDPRQMLSDLVNAVIALNLKAGISNAFDSKLAVVIQALDDSRNQNDAAAINALNAFMNAVNAQRGVWLTDSQADGLISSARAIAQALGG